MSPPRGGRAADRDAALAFGRDVYSGHGKIEILPKVKARTLSEMATAYTPGVGHVVRHLLEHPDQLDMQTAHGNMIALVTDGTAVLGLGNTGPSAAIPVMEGKAMMFKSLTGLDCMPLCLRTDSIDYFCDTVAALEPSFSGINLEDVAAPACFEIVRRLEERLSIPVLHDDQFGTATVVTAAMINALKATGRTAAQCSVVINGIGAAGAAAVRMLEELGIGNIIAVDRSGILDADDEAAHPHWREIAARTNRDGLRGDLSTAMKGADAFVGLSKGGLVSQEMVRSMADRPIVLALANPEPEIDPEDAVEAGAAVAASGRFDYPNHCNNVLAFPGLMRGAVEVKAKRISLTMCLAAATTIASHGSDAPESGALLPSPLDLSVHAAVAEAVGRQAIIEKLALRPIKTGAIRDRTLRLTTLVHERMADV